MKGWAVVYIQGLTMGAGMKKVGHLGKKVGHFKKRLGTFGDMCGIGKKGPEGVYLSSPPSQKRLTFRMKEKPENPRKFNDPAQEIFLEILAETGLHYTAAASVDVSASLVYRYRKLDPDFNERYEAAMQSYRDTLVKELHRRAVEGLVEKKYHQGLPVLDYELDSKGQPKLDAEGNPKVIGQAYTRRFSDDLLKMAVRRHCPEFNEKSQVDMNVQGLTELLEEIKPSTGLPGDTDQVPDDDDKRLH